MRLIPAPSPTVLVQALRTPRYEVLPVDGVEDDVAAHVPVDLPITVTASPRRGLDVTITLAEQLSGAGYTAIPHLAARQVVDRSHLTEILDRLDRADVRDVFVVAGDSPRAQGRFADSLSLLHAMNEVGPRPPRIGIAAYPEGHPFIGADELAEALATKAPMASYLVTQLCFDPAAIRGWVEHARADGLAHPVYLGMAGVVGRRRLMRISGRIGVGASARFLRKHRWPLLRLLLPRAYRPDRMAHDLLPVLAAPPPGDGLHIYTFNNLKDTEQWRKRTLSRLESAASQDVTQRPAE
jgi:methylenetetrahydrofolate reductase (NADPH)